MPNAAPPRCAPPGKACHEAHKASHQGVAVSRRPSGALLAAVAAMLALALWDPGWTGRRQAHEWMAVIDVTQSMDVADMWVGDDPSPVSRSQRTRQLLLQTLPQLPCGSRLGLAIFTEYRSLLLLSPVEVCEHYTELKATLQAMDSRMGWSGNSEIAKGLYSALAASKGLSGRPSVVFFSDGHEAPPLDARYRPAFNGQAGEVKGLLVGVGGDKALPIPRHDPTGQPIGTWGADDVAQRNPRSAGRGASVENESMVDSGAASEASMPGAVPGREHLSALREVYLQLLARETALGYHRLTDAQALRSALLSPDLAHETDVRVSLRWPATLLALLGLLAFYLWPWASDWRARLATWPHR